MTWVLLLLLVACVREPDLACARGLHGWVTVPAAAWLERASLRHVIVVMLSIAMLFGGVEFLFLAGAFEGGAALVLWDVSLVVEAMLATKLVAPLSRLARPIWRRVVIVDRRRGARARRRRHSRSLITRRTPPPRDPRFTSRSGDSPDIRRAAVA